MALIRSPAVTDISICALPPLGKETLYNMGPGVAVGVGVFVGPGIPVGVVVAVGPGVTVGVGVAVAVSVGVGLGLTVGDGVGVGCVARMSL